MAKPIPDRWQDYKPIGKKIEGTRFIAFKVPLRQHISDNVDNKIRLDGGILLKAIPNLGLIIDLTNTCRYYDPYIFEKEGIAYKKIMTPGKETPHKSISDEFIMVVKKFLEKNKDNDKLIGVHCTHGVNRTGYFICNYMISELTVDPNEAINRFANARGYKIERENYLKALHKLPETKNQDYGKRREVDNHTNTSTYNWRERGELDDLPRTSAQNYRERRELNDLPRGRERRYFDRPRDNWRQRREHYKDRYSSYGYEVSYSHRERDRRIKSNFPYSRHSSRESSQMSDHIQKRFDDNLPPSITNKMQSHVGNTNLYRPPQSREDYNSNRPVSERLSSKHQERYKYILKP